MRFSVAIILITLSTSAFAAQTMRATWYGAELAGNRRDGLALPDRERDPVDRLHGRDLLLENDPARDREMLLEILDDEQLAARHAALRDGSRA